MVKTTTKQKTVDYESRSIYCDLCEEEVPEGQVTIQLMPSIARAQGERYRGSDEHKIDICSVDCMVKNAAAAGLVLNTKILPDLRGKMGKPIGQTNYDMFEMEKKAAYDKKRSPFSPFDDFKKVAESLPTKYASKFVSTYKSFDQYATQIKK